MLSRWKTDRAHTEAPLSWRRRIDRFAVALDISSAIRYSAALRAEGTLSLSPNSAREVVAAVDRCEDTFVTEPPRIAQEN